MALEVHKVLTYSDLPALDVDLSLEVSSAFVAPQARPWGLHGASSGAPLPMGRGLGAPGGPPVSTAPPHGQDPAQTSFQSPVWSVPSNCSSIVISGKLSKMQTGSCYSLALNPSKVPILLSTKFQTFPPKATETYSMSPHVYGMRIPGLTR